MSVSFKVENIEISAVRDRAMFNTFAGNKSYVVKNIGDELSVSYSSTSFVVELGTGEAVICGGSMLSEGEASTLTVGESETGYLVIEVDVSQTGTNVCQFKNVPTLTQQDINNGGYIYDLPLYRYTTNMNGVQSVVDVREIMDNAFDGKQDRLTAGNGLKIENDVISSIYQLIAGNGIKVLNDPEGRNGTIMVDTDVVWTDAKHTMFDNYLTREISNIKTETTPSYPTSLLGVADAVGNFKSFIANVTTSLTAKLTGGAGFSATIIGKKISSSNYVQWLLFNKDNLVIGKTDLDADDEVDYKTERVFITLSKSELKQRVSFTGNFKENGETSGGYFYVYSTGATIEVFGVATPTADIPYSSTNIVMGTLPAGFRPSRELVQVCQGSGNNIWTLRVITNGNVCFSRYRNESGNQTCPIGAWLPFHFTFLKS